MRWIGFGEPRSAEDAAGSYHRQGFIRLIAENCDPVNNEAFIAICVKRMMKLFRRQP
jgi:hypothetical protein